MVSCVIRVQQSNLECRFTVAFLILAIMNCSPNKTLQSVVHYYYYYSYTGGTLLRCTVFGRVRFPMRMWELTTCVTTDMKSTSRCLDTDISLLLHMWEVATSLPLPPRGIAIDLILPAALGPGVDSACNRNEYQESSCRGKMRQERKADNFAIS
jgi:hypothetical protein